MSRGDVMLAYARQQVGKPYKLGAHGPSLYDCSGLTMEAAKLVGLAWYHGATTQWRRGSQTGDPARYGYWLETGTIDTLPVDKFVVLFHADAAKRGVMAHTGLYDGAGRVVQAGGYGGKGVHEGPIDRRRWSHWATLREPDDTVQAEPVADAASVPATIRRGSTGDTVRQLQAWLNDVRGGDPLQVDGAFGPVTDAAVRAYQGAKGLTVDGVVGPKTWQALDAGRANAAKTTQDGD